MTEHFHSPYSEYDVLEKRESPSWNEQTREVVDARLGQVPERRFLEAREWATLEAVCDRLMPQPDRTRDPVPIVPWIDRQLHENRGSGYRYEDMPPLRQAWRLGIAGVENESLRRHGAAFTTLRPQQQDRLLEAIQNGEVEGDPWDSLRPERFFTGLLLDTVVGIYYAHPAAWSEIGYGGPASPRGYVRLGMNQRDPWEAKKTDA